MRGKKFLKPLKLLVLLLLLLCGCQTSESNDISNKSLYISFNVSRQTDDGKNVIDIYTYDLTTNKIEKKDEVPYNSQYALAAYSAKSNSIYFSRREEGTNLDNLYEYQRTSKKTIKLTESLFAINFIIPYEDHVYMVAIPSDTKDFTLYLYDYENEKLSSFIDDKIFSIWQMNINPISGDLLLSGYSSYEDQKRMDNQNEIPYVAPSHSIYIKKQDTQVKLYQTKENEIIDSLCFTDRGTVIYLMQNQIYELENSSVKLQEALSSLNISQLIYMQNDTLYYISDKREVCSYSLKSDKVKVLFHSDVTLSVVQNAYILAK